MNEEIEALYALLGVKPDEASVTDAVNTLVKAVKSKLQSSIYGGKNGVITLPATIEGSYKNGKEIEKEIKDAYAAIYEKAKQMADESVSLTLKDIQDFKKQINKFSKMTAQKTGNDVIANARNNLNQAVSDYQDFVNQLRKESSAQQKVQIKVGKKKKAQKRAGRSSSILPSDEEIANDIARETKRRYAGLQIVKPKSYPKSSIDPGATNDHSFRLSEYSAHGSNLAIQQARALAEERKKQKAPEITQITKDTVIPKGKKTTDQEQNRFLNSNLLRQLGGSIVDLEKGKADGSFDEVYKNFGIVLKQFASTGKTFDETANAVKNIIEHPYSDNPKRRLGSTSGEAKGVGPGHEQALQAQANIYKMINDLSNSPETLMELGFVEKIYDEVTDTTKKIKDSIKKSKKPKDSAVTRRSQELANDPNVAKLIQSMGSVQKNLDDTHKIMKSSLQSIEGVNRSVKIGNTKEAVDSGNETKITKENKDINRDTAKAVKSDATTGFNTNDTANKLIDTNQKIATTLSTIAKSVEAITPKSTDKKKETSAIGLPESSKGLYKALNSATRLALPKPDGRRKKISDGLIDENPLKKTLPTVQQPNMKALDVLRDTFGKPLLTTTAKTLKEAINPSVIDKQNKINSSPSVEKDDNVYEDTDRLYKLAEWSNAKKRKRKEDMGELPPRYATPHIIATNTPEPQVEKSKIYASPIRQSIWDKFEQALENATGATQKYKDIINATAEEQDLYAAERIKKFGMNNGRNPNDTGDIASIKRSLELFRSNKSSIESNPELAQKIKLTPGREIDTTKIVEKLSKALSGRQMRNAQMGGSIPRQILGGMTGFIGMPSLEKSRTQADGLNQILGNINKALQSVLINIQTKETELSGMQQTGEAKFNADGALMKGSSSAAYKTLADLEEEKLVLDSILADMTMTDQIIDKTGGKFSKLVKQLSFTSPVLRENNGILRNMNAGLDKNGKALKFQTRTAEILNYTFQLMSRSIGQALKNWLSMLNPLNLIKRAFSDFMSYNTKWQRTMNVIKYNLRAIGRNLMDDIAQKLVNIIGFFDIISMKIQEAFGHTPISLFDQAAADSEKIHEELEAGANVTAGFDELHDIGSDNTGANDLLGDIYKPQLSPEWKKLANDIGDLFAHVIKGDMGFGEVMATIIKLLGETLVLLAKTIWDWFKNTAIGKYITSHWQGILATILTLFLGWKLLKVAGKLLFNALFNKLTESGISGVFSKVGNWITGFLGKSSFGQGIIQGFTDMLSGEGGLLKSLKFAFTNPSLITQMGGWGQMLGMIFVQALTAAIGGAIAIGGIAKGFDMVADTKSYNMGVEAAGGDDKDKKSDFGGKALATIAGGVGGGILAGALAGSAAGPIGIAIGAISGLLISSLAPAFEEVAVKAKDANNEMQKIEYYEGQVQGASSQVENFTELQNLMSDAVKNQTDKIYAQGEQLGISRTRMDELVKATQDGKFNTDLLTGSEQGLSDGLVQLSSLQEKNKSATEKLTEAKQKLQKAEMDLAIAQDIEAGNFEMAAARIEVALASNVYNGDEAGKKMAMILKDTNNNMSKYMLDDMSPEMKKNWEKYITTTEQGKQDMVLMYANMSDEQKKAFEKDYASEYGSAMQKTLQEGQKVINNTSFDWSHPFKSIGSMFTGDWSWKAKYASFDVGTNYVPNDGFAYIHKGEAIIPKDENVFARQGKAWDGQMSMNSQMMDAINRLEQTIAQGINVKGEFRQRGNDLVATVEKNKNRQSNNILNNKVYAR